MLRISDWCESLLLALHRARVHDTRGPRATSERRRELAGKKHEPSHCVERRERCGAPQPRTQGRIVCVAERQNRSGRQKPVPGCCGHDQRGVRSTRIDSHAASLHLSNVRGTHALRTTRNRSMIFMPP